MPGPRKTASPGRQHHPIEHQGHDDRRITGVGLVEFGHQLCFDAIVTTAGGNRRHRVERAVIQRRDGDGQFLVLQEDSQVVGIDLVEQRHRVVHRTKAAKCVERGQCAQHLRLGKRIAVGALGCVAGDALPFLAVEPCQRTFTTGVGLQ